MSIEIREEELHAFIDGELDDASRARVEGVCEKDPELRDRVARFRADKSRLVSLYGGGMSEPLPRAWVARIEAATARRPWRARSWAMAALAASFVLAFAAVVTYRQFQPAAQNDIVADALAARAGTLAPDSVVPVGSAGGAGAQSAVMTHALAVRLKVPDLAGMGYRLVAINAYSAPAPAFELRYVDRKGGEFTLYLRRSGSAPRFDQFKQTGLRVCLWQDDVIGMVMAGTMSAAEMQRLASAAYLGVEA